MPSQELLAHGRQMATQPWIEELQQKETYHFCFDDWQNDQEIPPNISPNFPL